MRTNKRGQGGEQTHGLADLKRLRKMAVPPKPSPPASPAAAGASQGGPATKNKSEHQGLTPEDTQLFRRAVKSVTPIKSTLRAILPPVDVAPKAILRQRRDKATGMDSVKLAQVSDHYTPAKVDQDDSSFVRAGHGTDVIKGLKRGKWSINATLDLHGNTLDEARERLDRFLQSCLQHDIKCVCVVHGKGYGSKDGEPVLKQTIRRWLTQMAAVSAYVECAEHDGGSGAVKVLLRTQSP